MTTATTAAAAATATTRMSLAGGGDGGDSAACSRSEALGRIGAAFLGAVVVGAGVPAPASAGSIAEANKKLSE